MCVVTAGGKDYGTPSYSKKKIKANHRNEVFRVSSSRVSQQGGNHC